MTPLDALNEAGKVAAGAITLYNAIQEQKRRRPDRGEPRLEVERMDAEALEIQRAISRYRCP